MALFKLDKKNAKLIYTTPFYQKETVLFICKAVFVFFNGNPRQTKLKCIITQDLLWVMQIVDVCND